MTAIIHLTKVIGTVAVFWDGSFKSTEAIEKTNIFHDMQVSFWQGHISYVDLEGNLKNCSRDRWLLRDGNIVREFVSKTDIKNLNYTIRK